MLDCQRCQMSVRYKIAVHARKGKEPLQYLGMPFSRLRYPRPLRSEPRKHLLPSIANWFRVFKHARVRDQAQERDHANPRKADRSGSIQLLIEPIPRAIVLRE